jgi:arginyl-tRNA--protein-N-Asp/Glu arginylyltransferase
LDGVYWRRAQRYLYDMATSQVQLVGLQENDACGYCKLGTSRSFYITAQVLDPADYQSLCDNGWRRSGTLAYVFDNPTTCCPVFTIRARCDKFEASKEQVRLVRRFNAYLRGELAGVQGGGGGGGGGGAAAAPPAEPADPVATLLDRAMRALVAVALPGAAGGLGEAPLVCAVRRPPSCTLLAGGAPASYSSAVAFRAAAALRRAMADGGAGAPQSPQGVAEALVAAARAAAAAPPGDAALAAALWPLAAQGARVLVAAAPTGHLNFALEGGVVVAAPGAAPAVPPPPPPPPPPAAPPPPPPPLPPAAGPRRTFSVTSVPAQFQEDAFRLWQRYQAAVHGDGPGELNKRSYTRFLCESPLRRVPWGGPPPPRAGAAAAGGAAPTPLERAEAALARAWAEGEGDGAGLPLRGAACGAGAPPALGWLRGFPREPDAVFPDLLDATAGAAAGPAGGLLAGGYGTFHHRYVLDGRLIAVGVVDVLPNCLSSVYSFYDPELAKTVPLGKLTALREVQWVQAVCGAPCAGGGGGGGGGGGSGAPLAAASPRLRSYYLGLYIPTCPKMRYKGDYGPAELLCPATRAGWVLLSGAGARLGARVPTLLADAEAAAWGENARAREAALGAALARLPLRVRGEVRPAGVLAALGPGAQQLLGALRNEWLPRAGLAVGARAVVEV